MPKLVGKAGDFCIWFISCLFFFCIIAGGGCLVMYMVLPDSPETSWLPVAGMSLVGIPWLFWFITFMYRCFLKRRIGEGEPLPSNNVAPSPPAAASVSTASATESPVESPGGGRRVHFGGVVVMGTGGNIAGQGDAQGVQGQVQEGHGLGQGLESECDSPSQVTTASDSSSLASRESELPLAFAMSS